MTNLHRILCLEDDLEASESLLDVLEDEGFQVVSCLTTITKMA